MEENARVISISDPSFNVSLFYVDRDGWTNYSKIDAEGMKSFIRKGAKYLFVSDENVLKEDFIQPYITDEIGNFKGIHIYKLPPPEAAG